MATVEVRKETFNDPETGRPIEFERLVITAYIDGIEYKQKIKLTKADMLSAKILLASEGKAPEVTLVEGGEVIPVRNEGIEGKLDALSDYPE